MKYSVIAHTRFIYQTLGSMFKLWRLSKLWQLRGTGQLQPHPPIFFFQKNEIFIQLEVYTYESFKTQKANKM